MAQRLLLEPQSDEDSDCEEDDFLLKDPTQSYYNVNFAPTPLSVSKKSYLGYTMKTPAARIISFDFYTSWP